MPAIRGVYYNHPLTAEPGIWIWLAWGGDKNIVGLSQTRIESIKLIGNLENRKLILKQVMVADLQTKCELRIALSNWTPEEQLMPVEDYCRIDGTDYVAQMCLIEVEVLSIDPIRFQITVSDGASRSQTAA